MKSLIVSRATTPTTVGGARVPPDVDVGERRIGLRSRLDPRDEAARRLPKFVQPLITLICGLPPSNSKKPQFKWERWSIYLMIATWCIVGVGGSMLAWIGFWANPSFLNALFFFAMTLPFWGLTVGGFRSCMTTGFHDVVHVLAPMVGKDKEKAKTIIYHFVIAWVAEFFCRLLFLPPICSYYIEHVLEHHVCKVFCTLADPDAAFLDRLGMKAGMSKAALWRRFWYLVLVPWSPLYCLYTGARIDASFNGTGVRTALTLGIWAALLIPLWWTGLLFPFLWAFVVPCFIGVPAAALAQFSSEHNWLLIRKDKTSRQYLEQTTRGRCFLDAPPDMNLPFIQRGLAWISWWFRLFFVHAPLRVMVCPFDLGPGHDLHHHGVLDKRKRSGSWPAWATWMNAGYARRLYEATAGPEDPCLTTYFSLFEALDTVFQTYSELDPNDPAVTEGKTTDLSGTILGM